MNEPTNEPLDLAAIEARLANATPGPWKWSYDFEIRGRHKHWCLYNPEQPDGGIGDGIRRCIDYHLVTYTTSDHYCEDEPDKLTEEEKADGKTWAARSLDTRPNFQLIAHAPVDIAALVKEVYRLREKVADLKDELNDCNNAKWE